MKSSDGEIQAAMLRRMDPWSAKNAVARVKASRDVIFESIHCHEQTEEIFSQVEKERKTLGLFYPSRKRASDF